MDSVDFYERKLNLTILVNFITDFFQRELSILSFLERKEIVRGS